MKIPTRIAFSFLFFIILSKSNFLAKAQNRTISVNVGVILDFDTWTGKMGLSCINMALADFYASNSYYKTRLLLSSRDSKSDVVEAAAAGKSPQIPLIHLCTNLWIIPHLHQSLSAVFSSYWVGILHSCSNGGIKRLII